MNPLVTVVVPHHLNQNDQYLRWCLKSILSSVDVDLEVICISDAEQKPDILNLQSDERLFFKWDHSLDNVTKKWHTGVKAAHPSSKYVMLISDDVMVSKYTIAGMVTTVGDNKIILGPASNCDTPGPTIDGSPSRYYTSFKVGNKTIDRKCVLEDFDTETLEKVIEYPIGRTILIDSGWVGFYCTMFPKKVLEAVGDFDEKLDVRGNDVDYCHRARMRGVPSLIDLGVFALHFGDRTLPHCTTEQSYAEATQALHDKYSHPAGKL